VRTKVLTDIRSRFLAVVVAGVILPVALAGFWISRSVQRSGEEELRVRAEQSLTDVAKAIGVRWVDARSALLRLAETEFTGQNGDAVWSALDGTADAITITDIQEKTRRSLDRRSPGNFATVGVRVPVYDPHASNQLGWISARLRLVSMLPSGFWWSGIAGSIPAVFEPGSNNSLIAIPMPASLLAGDAFDWSGQRWIVSRRSLNEPPLDLIVATPTGAFVAPFANAGRQAILALGVAFIVSLFLATWLTRRITKPLIRLSSAAGAVAEGELEQRVVEDGPAEIQRLARAFNAMTESLRVTLAELSHRDALMAVGEFAASLAHEVRNPLTSMRLDLERARERLSDPRRAEPLVSQALQQIDRLDAVVSSALRIARSGQLELQQLDLREPLSAAVHAAQPAFDRRQARLEYRAHGSDASCVEGNAAALQQLFLNLLLNAAESLSAGGKAEVVVQELADSMVISVRDEGVGIPAEQLTRILEPFFTTKEGGTGLGLTVARRTAEAHGGRITIHSIVGKGTSVEVHLPFRRSIPLRNVS
jgi:signal transduction histidine kinase